MDNEAFFNQAVECEKHGQVDLAATLYQRILDNIPAHPATLYNLATLNAKRNQYVLAIDLFKRMIAVEPDFVKAYYNLAICAMKIGQIDEAVTHLKTAVSLVPHYEAAQHLLGGILLRQGAWDEAHVHLNAALNANPNSPEAHCHQGMLCMHTSRIDEAKSHLEKAIQLDSSLVEAHYHLGLIALRRDNLDEADMHFQSTVSRDPMHFAAYYNLALIKKKQAQYNLARHYIEQAYALSHQHPFVAYMHSVLKKDTILDATPAAFVESLFDHYAQNYDEHLTTVLHSHLPEQCVTLFLKTIHTPITVTLDVGCGTGLSGRVFRPYTHQLLGADLSRHMLNKAQEKHIYDALYHENMFDTFKRFNHDIDLVLCCDALVYVGALEPFFEGIAHVLRPQGYALFTCEASNEAPFILSLDGRFSHAESYVRDCAKQHGFQIIAFEKTILRDQAGEGVPGYIVIAMPHQ